MTPLTDRNRQNSQSSTGPSSDAGKARSSQNALKTGLYSLAVVLPSEDPEEYQTHAESYVAYLKPQGPLELDLAKIVTDNVWRLRRVRTLSALQHKVVTDLTVHLSEHKGNDLIERMHTQSLRALESISRHEQRLNNAMLKVLKQLKDLQKETLLEQERASKQPKSGFVSAPKVQVATVAAETAQSIPETPSPTPQSPGPVEQKVAA